MSIQSVALKYFTAPLREMVADINSYLPDGQRYSHQALHLWLTGKRSPRYFTILYLSENSSGWVNDFAVDMLAALREDRHAR